MPYICENELISIYNSLESRFKNAGLQPEIALIRDYMMKIKVSENDKALGKLIIDYSSKKRSYNFRRDSDLPEGQFTRIIELLGQSDKLKEKNVIAEKTVKNRRSDVPEIAVSTPCYAYVDGSFIDGQTGFGAVILKEGQIAAELSGKVDTPEAFASRQVGGEIRAVIEVLEWCKKEKVKEITIFYDFQNIEKWATGEFRTNTPMTQAYKEYIDNCGISITWQKVASHTGVELNDRADELAKNGARSNL